ncbi:MAG: hypothetical protein WCK95_15800 [Alphaproteobacteria bacterium]
MVGVKRSVLGRRQALMGATGVGVAGVGAAGVVLTSGPVVAQQHVLSGTVNIEQVQVAFIGSGNIGGGTLHYRGKNYSFTIGGLGIGGFGFSKMEAYGDVYNLKELRQFPGVYGQARYGAVAGKDGGGEMWLQNPEGVMLSLKTRRQGLAVSAGADAIIIDFK